MKNIIFFFIAAVVGLSQASATPINISDNRYSLYDGNRYLFLEGGIEFSVYADGEFDFIVPQAVNNIQVNLNNSALNISYNTGFNYDAFVQYDNYGAVIQIADVPIYYDNWGRIAQAGNVVITYRDNRISRVGNLQIFYQGNSFAYTRGYINPYNRRINHYVYTDYFYRPFVDRCLVYNMPYRNAYNPHRYSYAYHRNQYRSGYNDGYANAYRTFNRPQGSIAHNNARAGSYRDARMAGSRSISRRSNVNPNNARVVRSSRSATSRVAPVSRNARSNRSSRSTAKARTTTNYRNRNAATVAQKSVPQVNRSSSPLYTQRSSRSVSTSANVAPSRSQTRAQSQNLSRSSGNFRSSGRSTDRNNSRSSRSSSSRSGGK